LLFVRQSFEGRDSRKSEIFLCPVSKGRALSFGRPELPTRAHLST
jgi:hypothetical protein